MRGIIKPEKERQVLRVNSSGQVLFSQLFPNASVQRGDTLLRLAQPVLEEKKQLLLAQMNECNEMLHDLQQLSEKKKRPDRALYQQPEILILDEATSSLDSQAEQYIKNTIQVLKEEQKTILLIAHRLSTVVQADQILVMKNGKVIEAGNHLDLIEKEGVYYQLWQQQTII